MSECDPSSGCRRACSIRGNRYVRQQFLTISSMKFIDMLQGAERSNDSLLCVGLDPEPSKFPGVWRGDASRIFDFCAAIVDATSDLVIAFKPQIAYFAAHRAEAQLERLIEHIHRVAPGVPVILDAKRGDIGSTAEQYAREAFERYQADAVTLSPLMGFDSIEPYLQYPDKGLILLCRPTARLRTHRAARARAVEPERSARARRRRDVSGRDRARALDCTDAAAVDPRHRCARRRCAGHRARRLARARRTHHRTDHRQLIARRAVCERRR